MRATLLAVILLGATGPARAVSVQYALESACQGNCAAIGLENGNPLFGLMEVSLDDYAEGSSLGRDDLVSFSVRVVTANISRPTLGGYAFGGVWGDRRGDIDELEIFVSNAVSPGAVGPIFATTGSQTFVSLSGRCFGALCRGADLGDPATFAPLKVDRIKPGGQPAPVPLPPAGLLLLAGIASLGLAGSAARRRAFPSDCPEPSPRRPAYSRS